MKKLLLTLSLASLAVACRSTADVADTSSSTPAEECSAAQADCCSTEADAACKSDDASCEEAAELQVCPVTGKVLEN